MATNELYPEFTPEMKKTHTILAPNAMPVHFSLMGSVFKDAGYKIKFLDYSGQKVIDTGLYGIVRHPMYMATLFLFLAMPLVLGSVISFVIMLAYIPIIIKRLRNEEQVLAEGLPGYREYMGKVKYRLLPFVW